MVGRKARGRKSTPNSATTKSKRKQFTPEQRARILSEAKGQNLTGKQVEKKYKISSVTYYLWRSKTGGRRSGVTRRRRGAGGDLGSQVRAEVQSRVRAILPGVVHAEVTTYLDSIFSSGRRRARV